MIEFLNFYLIPGIVLGSIYALGAIGITLTFGILRFTNFAHGEIMTFAVYVTLTLIWLTGWHPLALLPLAMAVTSVVTLGIDRVFYKPLRASPTIILVMASFGMMLMVRSIDPVQLGSAASDLPAGHSAPLCPVRCSAPVAEACGHRDCRSRC